MNETFLKIHAKIQRAHMQGGIPRAIDAWINIIQDRSRVIEDRLIGHIYSNGFGIQPSVLPITAGEQA